MHQHTPTPSSDITQVPRSCMLTPIPPTYYFPNPIAASLAISTLAISHQLTIRPGQNWIVSFSPSSRHLKCFELSNRSRDRTDVPQWTSNGPYPTHHHHHGLPTTIQRQYPQFWKNNWVGIIRSFMKPKHSKSWDIRYHWLEDRTKIGHLNHYWEWGINYWVDYFSKHHTPAYHKIMRYNYLQKLHMMMNKFLSNYILQSAMHATKCLRVC